MKKLHITFFFIFITSLAFAVEPEYMTITPKSGDGILSILRRYKLLDSKCDKDHFYEINKLSSKSSIYTDRKYKLPIALDAANAVDDMFSAKRLFEVIDEKLKTSM